MRVRQPMLRSPGGKSERNLWGIRRRMGNQRAQSPRSDSEKPRWVGASPLERALPAVFSSCSPELISTSPIDPVIRTRDSALTQPMSRAGVSPPCSMASTRSAGLQPHRAGTGSGFRNNASTASRRLGTNSSDEASTPSPAGDASRPRPRPGPFAQVVTAQSQPRLQDRVNR